MAKPNRLPRRIPLGRDVTAVIRVVPPRAVAEALGEEDHPQSEWPVGAWDPDDNVIYISKRLSLAERWDCYRHECIHAMNDTIARANPSPLII